MSADSSPPARTAWESPTPGNWATVDLRQPNSTRNAIGAWLEIDGPQGTEWRERTIGGGHVSGSLLPFHIGMGDAQSIRVRPHWPDGTAGDWLNIAAGDQITLAR